MDDLHRHVGVAVPNPRIAKGEAFVVDAEKVAGHGVGITGVFPVALADPTTSRSISSIFRPPLQPDPGDLNDIFFKACITFDKTIAPFSLAGPEFDGPLNAAAQRRVRRRMLAALEDAGIDLGCCFVVGIIQQDLVGSKANTVAGNGPTGGTILMEEQYLDNGRSLGHECGHASENDPGSNDHDHPHGADNLMRPTDGGATGTDISTSDPDGAGPEESQAEEFRSNPRFKDKPRNYYAWKIPDNLA